MPDIARQRIGLPRVFVPIVECPAGEPISETIEGSGVHCAVTESEITAVGDPSSILQFCCSSGYRTCPVWMAEKERIWAERSEPLIHDPRPLSWEY